MQFLIDSYRNHKTLHHAYAFEGETELVQRSLLQFFVEELKYPIQANPDLTILTLGTFGVDDARALSLQQMRKSLSGQKKIFVISFLSITVEAQNALLKVFEDPTPNTHFFVILDSFERLLPTLRSRMMFVTRLEYDNAQSLRDGKVFMHSSMVERLAMIESIGEEKDKRQAKELLHGVEEVLNVLFQKNHSKEIAQSIEEVIQTKVYLDDRSPSIKMLLEHIAHVLPIL